MKNKHGLQTIVFTVFLLLGQWIVLSHMALAQTPFYEGKNLVLVSGTDAGGAGDLRTRAVIPVLKKHIPGHPNIVMLDMKEPRLVTGYTPREIDFALDTNEIDARVSILDSLLTRNAHWLEKDLVHVHATMDIPKGFKHNDRRLAKLPEIESFTRSNGDRRLIQLFRGARETGQPFVL